ncbi:MAG TPA: hypothetical protein VMS17_01015 [Gemmataceae bacterium]|nr:hypothetical protein [Gemmataceae bacterium]
MKLRNVLTVLGTATITAVLTLALLAPWAGKAEAGPTVHPTIAQAQLASHNCTFSLTTDKPDYEAGQTPQIEVKAVNPTDQPATVSVWVTVTTTSPASRMSRMLPMPTVVWSHEFAFTLKPDETKSLTATCAAMPALGNVAILLSDQNMSVLAGVYGVPAQTQTQVNNQAANNQAVVNAVHAAQNAANVPPQAAAKQP